MVKIKVHVISTTVPYCEIYKYNGGFAFFNPSLVLISSNSQYVHLSFYTSKSWHDLSSPVICSDKTVTLPSLFNMELLKPLRTDVAPGVFTHRAVYIGHKFGFTGMFKSSCTDTVTSHYEFRALCSTIIASF